MKKLICTVLLLSTLLSLNSCIFRFDDPAVTTDGATRNEPNQTSDAQGDTTPSDTNSTPSPVTDTPTSDTPVTEPPTPNPQEKRISFLACGDNVGHDSVLADAKKRATAQSYPYNFAPMYDGILPLLRSTDIKFINQETITGDEKYGYHGYPSFNTPQDMGRTLVDLGFDVVNIASNHMLDMKAACLTSAIQFWKSQSSVLMIGGYENQTDFDTVRVFDYEGIRIAFLSYTYGTNGYTLDAGSSLIIPYINEADIRRQVAAAKSQADLVFVSMHWGTDSSLTVTNEQKKYAAILAELNVDVVIGHHSHTLQDMEWKDGTNGHKTLVIYSLGNLLHSMYYDTQYTPNYSFLVGGIATFDIVKKADGTLTVENPMYRPTVCHYTKDPTGAYHAANFQIYELKDYTQELCAQHGALVQHKFNLDDLYAYVRKQVSPEFLPAEYR